MIRVPRLDIEKCEAFKVPYFDGKDMYFFHMAQQNDDFESLRMSSFSKRRVFSFEKFERYINSFSGKVFLNQTEKGEFYVISACNIDELNSIMCGNHIPVFCQNYDFEKDVYIRKSPIEELRKQLNSK